MPHVQSITPSAARAEKTVAGSLLRREAETAEAEFLCSLLHREPEAPEAESVYTTTPAA